MPQEEALTTSRPGIDNSTITTCSVTSMAIRLELEMSFLFSLCICFVLVDRVYEQRLGGLSFNLESSSESNMA